MGPYLSDVICHESKHEIWQAQDDMMICAVLQFVVSLKMLRLQKDKQQCWQEVQQSGQLSYSLSQKLREQLVSLLLVKCIFIVAVGAHLENTPEMT
jgi:hypothetical protein